MSEKTPKASPVRISGVSRIIKRELIPFTRQTASMLNAGMSILAAISTLEDQCVNPGFKIVLRTLRENIESGMPFSDGLRHFPQIFDDMYLNMVAAGEKSGQFAPVLKRLAVMLDASARLVRKVKSAMTYPIVVLSMALLIAGALITFVVPIFVEMFEGFGSKLPAPTQFLVNLSDFIRGYWYVLFPAIVVAVIVFRKWKATAAGRYQYDKFVLKMPVFGDLVQKVSVARFSRLFAQMLVSGVPILDAMQVVALSIGNKVIEGSILDARTGIEQGNTLSASLEGKPFLPTLMIRMIAAGEKSGRIDEMLDSVADTYDDEVETTLSALTSLMEPLLMVFLGLIIGSIVVAMYLPIFKLGTVVNN
ncbi:MAG TPA: type II secretion system F family protein [Kiritimatiellia bacterium]|nr:type II secretion system F family protein [Kiritimatiellia bacterium]HRU70395.1 type II secretion system F family protein [Kiritimatiellia bacterium]